MLLYCISFTKIATTLTKSDFFFNTFRRWFRFHWYVFAHISGIKKACIVVRARREVRAIVTGVRGRPHVWVRMVVMNVLMKFLGPKGLHNRSVNGSIGTNTHISRPLRVRVTGIIGRSICSSNRRTYKKLTLKAFLGGELKYSIRVKSSPTLNKDNTIKTDFPS